MKERSNLKVLDEEGFKKEMLKGVFYEGGKTRRKERMLLKETLKKTLTRNIYKKS